MEGLTNELARNAATVAEVSAPGRTGLVEGALIANSAQNSSAPASVHPVEPLAAGGPDPQRFDWAEAWHPVSYLSDLATDKPTPITMLGEDLVIWWEPSAQTWRVFADRCPHRLARLSEGRISEAGQLECPYHGWAFSGSGQCEAIPQLPEGANGLESPRACVRSLPTAVHQGLLFAYPGKAENAVRTPVPVIEPMTDGDPDWICINTMRELPYDALTLLENVLDPSHVPFTHHRTVGNRASVSPVNLELVAESKQGFTGVWQEGPRRGTLGRQDTRFIAPNLMWHDLTSKQFGRTLTVVYAVPIRKGECRLFARFPFKFASPWPRRFIGLTPEWYSHINQNAILEDDQIFLHYQERYLAEAGGSDRYAKAFYLPTQADLFVAQLHKWLSQYQADPFPGQSLPPARTKEQLLDRYHSHTVNCASCRGALVNLNRIRWGLLMAGAIAWAIIPLLLTVSSLPSWAGGVASGMALVLLGAWASLGQLKRRFYQGRQHPPRNQPEKSKARKS